jgi:hypothetical protein
VKSLLAFLFEGRFIVPLNQCRFLPVFFDQCQAALIAGELKKLGKKFPPKENRVADLSSKARRNDRIRLAGC